MKNTKPEINFDLFSNAGKKGQKVLKKKYGETYYSDLAKKRWDKRKLTPPPQV